MEGEYYILRDGYSRGKVAFAAGSESTNVFVVCFIGVIDSHMSEI